MTAALASLAVIVAVIVSVIAVISLRGRRDLTTPAERAVHATLHTASLAAKPLRDGLDTRSAA
ncbi:MAG: sensor histidine kinase, partial [Rhodococcus sp. (in: high G+C Gram-positive bacteria)]